VEGKKRYEKGRREENEERKRNQRKSETVFLSKCCDEFNTSLKRHL
jgi:hypothetical protein